MRDGIKTFLQAFPTARSMWSAKVDQVGTLEAFWLGKTLVIIQEYADGDGWQAFTPTTDDGRINETINAIADRAGVARPERTP